MAIHLILLALNVSWRMNEMTLLEVSEILDASKGVAGFDLGSAATASLERIRAAYNGCGPDRWPENVRESLDDMTRLFAPSILVHDVDFDYSDGTDKRLHEANSRLHSNNRAILRHRYPLLSWQMLKSEYRRERAKAVAVMAALNAFTGDTLTRKAWLAAHERNRGENDWGVGCP